MFFYFFLFIFGTAIGSFLNVLIDRLPKEESINGRSYCDHCHKSLRWYQLIPIISYIFLGGRCQFCQKKISPRYPLVEFLTGVIFILTWQFSPAMIFIKLVYLGIVACLIVIFFTDVKYHLIPDSIQAVLFLFALFFQGLTSFSNDQLPLVNYLISQFVYFSLSAFLVTLPIFFLWLVSRGRAMGFGDVKLSFTIGFLLGWQAGFLALYFAFISGGLVGLLLILLGKKKLKSKIAFGPFLVIGMIIMLFWGELIFELIKGIYGF